MGPTPLHRVNPACARYIFSQVVMAFLVGVGDEEPLRYRILPINKFMNLGAQRLSHTLHVCAAQVCAASLACTAHVCTGQLLRGSHCTSAVIDS